MPARLAAAPCLLVAALALALMLTGCGTARPRMCSASNDCGAGDSCVIGKCAASDAPSPVANAAHLVVLVPDQVAFITSDGADGERPAALFLGATIGSEGRILLRFPRGSWPHDAVVKAYLVLDRVEGAQAGPGDVVLRAESIVEPWSVNGDARTSWASPPSSQSIVGGDARVRARGTGPIRIEVTSFAVQLGNKGDRPWGLRVEASGSGFGVPIATGYGAGFAPHLEVFTQ